MNSGSAANEGLSPAERTAILKRQAGYKSVENHVKSGMVVGLGTGSTAYYAVERVGQLLSSGTLSDIIAVPTSKRTEEQARSLGIPLTTLDSHSVLDVAIDGADTADTNTFGLVKGGGGALLREKLVVAAAKKFVVIVDEHKLADGLGDSFAVPVEVIQFAHQHISRKIQGLPSIQGCDPKLRMVKAGGDGGESMPYVTDNGNYIVDLHFKKPLPDPRAAAKEIAGVVGVVEHGLFLDMASELIIAGKGGVRSLDHPVVSN
ncbi:unnamed protein product [Discosporangium mesarthrocarpum]